MSETLGYIHSVETFGLVDGPGVRYIIFLQGCAMRCQYCHNPETWAFTKETASTPQEAFAAAYRYRNYWRGNGGLTISGGEPLLQLDFVSEVFRLARAKKVQTALDTSAQPFAPDNAEWMARFDRLLENTDLVILDLKEIDDEKHKKLTGHSNKNILAMAQYVAARGVDLWIRHVLVPGLTDDADGLRQLDAFIKTLPTVRRVEILPYTRWDCSSGRTLVSRTRWTACAYPRRRRSKPRSSFCMCAIIPMHPRAAPQSNFYKNTGNYFGKMLDITAAIW